MCTYYRKVAGSDVNFSKAERNLYSHLPDKFSTKDIEDLARKDSKPILSYVGVVRSLVRKNVVVNINKNRKHNSAIYVKMHRPTTFETMMHIYDYLPQSFTYTQFKETAIENGVPRESISVYFINMFKYNYAQEMKGENTCTSRTFNLQVKEEGAPELSSYKDKELLDELVRRGYWWDKMTCTYTVKYPWSGSRSTCRNLEDMNGAV